MCKIMFEHILHYMLLPGKSENWVVIVDLIDLGLTSLPLAVKCFIHSIGFERNDWNFASQLQFQIRQNVCSKCLLWNHGRMESRFQFHQSRYSE